VRRRRPARVCVRAAAAASGHRRGDARCRRTHGGFRLPRPLVCVGARSHRSAAARSENPPGQALGGDMSTMRTMWLAALFTTAACVSPEEHRRVLGANEALKAEILSLTQTQHAISRENEQLRADLERVGKQ